MIPKGTLRKRCSNCHTLVLVTSYSPNEDSRLMLNGFWVTSMDEDFNNHNRGFLCEPCLERLCFEKGQVGFGGFGRAEERFENYEVVLSGDQPWNNIRGDGKVGGIQK